MDLAQRRLGFAEVLDGAHGVDGVEAAVAEGQAPHVGHRGAEARVRERGPRLPDGRLGDVDAEDGRALPMHPLQDARVLDLVPQVGLEHRAPAESGTCSESSLFSFSK